MDKHIHENEAYVIVYANKATQLTITIPWIWFASADLKYIGAKSGKCISRKGSVLPSSDNDGLAADDGGIGASTDIFRYGQRAVHCG